VREKQMSISRGASFVTVAWPAIRLAAGIALATGACLAFWQRYEGGCLIPWEEATALVGLWVLFVVGFVWAAYELTLRFLPNDWSSACRHLSALGAGILVYTLLGAVIWAINPTTAYPENNLRQLLAVHWPAVILLEGGAFTEYGCGA
jgi:hypothetical protein